MRARLALAQALLPNPELLILDEPSDGLDPEGIHEMRHTILRLHRELKLTILLSSHFLSEVEQICTRIAVLNQGRMVFEGTLGETKRQEQWVRIRVGNFPRAAAELRKAELIKEDKNGQLIALAPKVQSDQVVRLLVEKGISVFEITPAEETLETFYLRLMAKSGANDGPGQ